MCSAQVMLATAFQSKQQARCAIQDRAVLLSRVFPEPDGALLAGSGVCEQKREREHECERMAWHGRPGRRDSRQRAGQDSSEGERSLGTQRSAASVAQEQCENKHGAS